TAIGKKLQTVVNPTDAPAIAVRCSLWLAPRVLPANSVLMTADCVVTRTYLIEASVPAGTVLPFVLSYQVAPEAKLFENSTFTMVTFGGVTPVRLKPYLLVRLADMACVTASARPLVPEFNSRAAASAAA